jgi:hypothetical protein
MMGRRYCFVRAVAPSKVSCQIRQTVSAAISSPLQGETSKEIQERLAGELLQRKSREGTGRVAATDH